MTRQVHGMTLTITHNGWKGTHPLGSQVDFYTFEKTEGGKTKKLWKWTYAESTCDGGFVKLQDAVEDWRRAHNLVIPGDNKQ
jgi:hypothetical protein